MTKTLILLPLLFLCLLGNSQDFHVSLFDRLDAAHSTAALKTSGDGFISVSVNNNHKQISYVSGRLSTSHFGLVLRKHDHAQQVVREQPLSNGGMTFGPFPPDLMYLDSRLCLVYYQYRADDNVSIMAAIVDTNTLTLQSPRELFALDQKGLMVYNMSMLDRRNTILSESPDGSKVLALWNSGKDNIVRLHVLDRNLQSLWSKNESPGDKSAFKLFDGCVGNNGDAFVSYTIHIDRDQTEGHVLLAQEKRPTLDKPIRMPEGYPWEVRLAAALDGSCINVVGTYVGEGAIGGVYSTRVNTADLSLATVKTMPVPGPVLEAFKQDTWAKTKRKEYGLLPIEMHAFALRDGSIDMIGEFRRDEYGMQPNHVFTLSGDLLWVHFSGGKADFNRIPKIRVSAESTIGDSYHAVRWKDRMLVFYNDRESNMNKDMPDFPSRSDRYNDLMLVAATITPEGMVKRQKVADLSKESYLAITDELEAINSSTYQVLFQRIKGLGGLSNDFKLATITVE